MGLIVCAGPAAGSLALADTTPTDVDPRQAPHAAFSPVNVNTDGSVTVDGMTYRDMSAWHRSVAFQSADRRCGALAPPMSTFAPSDCSFSSTTVLPDYQPGDEFVIPVVFHIIENTAGEGAISDELIASQLDVLNEDFQAIAGSLGAPGTNATIRFVMATVDPDGNPTTGIERIVDNSFFRDSSATKPSLVWNPDIYFNVYTNEASGALGYATFPQFSAGDPDDGVVLLWTSVGRDAPLGGEYNLGRTATHEVGHYFGLFHTFQDGCGSAGAPYTTGDLIGDTARERNPTFGCPAGATNGCNDGAQAPVDNYMDYSDDICMDHFTPEQINRMRCSILHYRESLLNQWPDAAFTAQTTDGVTFAFTDASTDPNDVIVAWSWDFGDGSLVDTQTASHTFAEFGTFDVALTVTDSFGAKRRIVQTVVADPPPIADFAFDPDGLVIKFLDESVDPNGSVVAWEWDFGDGGTAAEQNPVHAYALADSYVVRLTVTDEAGATASFTAEVTVSEDAGCGCAVSGGSTRDHLPWLAGLLLGMALVFRRRRR